MGDVKSQINVILNIAYLIVYDGEFCINSYSVLNLTTNLHLDFSYFKDQNKRQLISQETMVLFHHSKMSWSDHFCSLGFKNWLLMDSQQCTTKYTKKYYRLYHTYVNISMYNK